MDYLTGKTYAGVLCIFWHTEDATYIFNAKNGELMGVIK